MMVLLVLAIVPRTEAQDKALGSTPSDESIRRALVYLKESQKADGGWDAGFGRATSVTSLAVMSFLASGHVPGEPGPYRETIDRGIRYVLAHQKANGMLVANTSHGPMYCHGISTLMLAEVVGMTNDASLADQCRAALSRAVDLILKAQDVPSKRKDTRQRRRLAVSAVVDRQRPERLGLAGDGPPGGEVGRLRGARRRTSTGRSATSRSAPPKAAGSATSPAASRTTRGPAPASSPSEICGEHLTPEAVAGAEYLVKHPPRWGSQYFFYEVYYCPQALFQVGDQYFNAYYPKLVDDPPGAPGQGRARGSPATATTAPAAGSTAPRWPCWPWRSSIGICRSINVDAKNHPDRKSTVVRSYLLTLCDRFWQIVRAGSTLAKPRAGR